MILAGGRMGEIPSQAYTLFSIPKPACRFVHVHAEATELGLVYAADLAIHASPAAVRGGTRSSRTAHGTRPGPARPRRRMPIISPGPRSRRRNQAGVNFGSVMVWLRNNVSPRDDRLQRRRQFHDVDPPLLPVPPLRQPSRADRRARWATACPAAVAMQRLYPRATDPLHRRRRRLPDDRAGVRHRRAIRPADRHGDRRQRGSMGRSACTRSANIRRASARPTCATRILQPMPAPSAAFGVTVETTADFGSAFEAARASGLPAIVHCKIDPNAILPGTTLMRIREKALGA